jgi:hypothetical protein
VKRIGCFIGEIVPGSMSPLKERKEGMEKGR